MLNTHTSYTILLEIREGYPSVDVLNSMWVRNEHASAGLILATNKAHPVSSKQPASRTNRSLTRSQIGDYASAYLTCTM